MAEAVRVKRIKVGEAKIREGAPAKPPAKPPTTPPTKPQLLTPEEWAEQHRSVKTAVDKYAKLGFCVTPELVEKETGIDPKTANTHLEVMVTDKAAAKVADLDGRPVYCSHELIAKLAEDLKKLE